MKIVISLFSICFLLLSTLPCCVNNIFEKPDTCCETDSHGHNQKSSQQDEKDNGCNGCNPLSSCHCTSSFISFSHSINFLNVFVSSDKQIRYLTIIPPSVAHSIWQPPKIS